MVTITINIPQMLAYIPAPWILWVFDHVLHQMSGLALPFQGVD